MPLMAFAMVFSFAFLAFVMDVMREITILAQMKHAAAACALDLLPFAALDEHGLPDNIQVINSDGSFSSTALSSMQQELARQNGESAGTVWNSALDPGIGSETNPQSEIRILASDMVSPSATNPNLNDRNDPILQVSARRRGGQAMELLFMPVRYTAELMSGNAVPDQARRQDLARTAEVVAQPAVRVGAAAAPFAGSSRSQLLFNGRIAAFPLAINYDDFKRLIQSNSSAASLNASLNAKTPGSAQSPAASDLRAYFVNLKSGGTVGAYYFDAQSPQSIDQLTGLIEYFSPQASGPKALELPAAVEQDSLLDRFAVAELSSDTDFNQVLQTLPLDRCYIMPVVSENAAIASQCHVVGFAFLKLRTLTNNSGNISLQVELGESLPLPNASAGSRFRCIPAFDGSRMSALYDAAESVFKPRDYDFANSSLSARPPGILLAPVLSPRLVQSNPGS